MQTFADLYRYRFVLSNLVAKNLKVLYRNMALGFLWSLLNPLVLVVVLTVVWVLFFGQTIDFALKVLVTLIPYNLFTYCISGCTTAIRDNANLVKRVAFPRQILPVSVVLTHLVQFPVQLSLVLVGLAILPHPGSALSVHLLWIIPIFVIQIGLCLGSGFLVAALNVRYRDVRYVVDSLLVVLFWLCPVLYVARDRLATESIWLQVAYFLNPMSGILEGYRDVLFFGRSPELLSLGLAFAVTTVIGIVGVRTFWVQEKHFADLV